MTATRRRYTDPTQPRGPVPATDRAVRGAWRCLLLLAVASGSAWWAVGDTELGVTRPWALVVAGIAGVLAIVALVPIVLGVIATAKQARGAEPRRPGTARAVVALLVAVAAVAGATALVAPLAADARDEQELIDAAEATAARQKGRTQQAPRTKAERTEARVGAPLADLEPGTCLAWPEGPTTGDRLQNSAEGLSARRVRCTLPHGYEAIGRAAAGGGAAYPGAQVLVAAAEGPCQQRLLDYLTPKGGTRPAATSWGAYGIAPTAAQWEQGTRDVNCIAIPPRFGVERTSSLAGAG